MENANRLKCSVSEFLALTNQTLEYAYPLIDIEGEVSSFKVNQSKYVFFDLKDAKGSINCFMTVWQLRTPIEDGMKVTITASPKLTQWGKFSLTVKAIRLSGEGSLKKSFELLRAKLQAEGLFAQDRKRPIPAIPKHVGVISSTDAAGYADFVKILNDRWGNINVEVAHVQVQGVTAPDQMIRALRYFNSQEKLLDAIVIIRGGGSTDDLSAFNDELLVREIAVSRTPTVVGVGHEVDTTLADLVADVRASTPSNAAQLLTPDRHEQLSRIEAKKGLLYTKVERMIDTHRHSIEMQLKQCFAKIEQQQQHYLDRLTVSRRLLAELNPRKVLERGYALIRGAIQVGSKIEIEEQYNIIKAEVTHVAKK